MLWNIFFIMLQLMIDTVSDKQYENSLLWLYGRIT